ncbi:N-acetyltransferase [Shewanella eurypsychrophilus]|uniref:N-acetyltransferase n=1 Tax=Shewanella eurypsychrophilus TaxID=2593656 RepID=A0ABX6V6P3_9GAMM|nr:MULTISPECIES: N-acetyltransferase [Shewanella]QFU22379.1 GNAT family N-acetyltransferase [Shewanella sp. YLB-09]QPG57666.1 N-acetyltransferase [Shewanella eurypsychrophilus]
MCITIRPEKTSDIQNIHKTTIAAFLDAPHTDHTEQFIVDALRDSGVLSVSLVAEDSSQIVGHIALSPVTISSHSSGWFGLGPISVIPTEQNKGIGSKLMHAALSELKNLNANGCVLLGDPSYYRRFGFKPIDGLVLPEVPPEYFQAVLLKGAYPTGIVTYHESFSAQG